MSRNQRIERAFIANKPLRVHWVPPKQSAQLENLLFITGSYGESVNSLDLHNFDLSRGTVKSLNQIPLSEGGDVSKIAYNESHDEFCVSTTAGELIILKVSSRGETVDKETTIRQVRVLRSSDFFVDTECFVDFDFYDDLLALVTGSGEIVCLPYGEQGLNYSINSWKDNVKCISFLRQNEIVTGNMRGQIHIWDYREDPLRPVLTFPYNVDLAVGVTSARPFPLQRHFLVASGADGSLSTWDLRNVSTRTQTVYNAHSKPVSCLRFHDVRPSNLFTSSLSGDIWHWASFDELLRRDASDARSELKPDVLSLLAEPYPVNCVDVYDEYLVGAVDNDSIVVVSPLQLK